MKQYGPDPEARMCITRIHSPNEPIEPSIVHNRKTYLLARARLVGPKKLTLLTRYLAE